MVQTYQSPVRVYKFPFELVMAAYHKRFPTCPQIPIFVGSEITYEWKAEDGGEEIVERKCQLNVEAPYLVKKIAGVDYVYFKQRNHLNLRARTLLIEASNISFASRIVVIENCRYYVHTENPEWTCFEQNSSLDVKSFFGLESAIEKLAVKQYSANIAKGKEVLEFFIDELIKSGVTHIPIWKGDEKDDEKTVNPSDDVGKIDSVKTPDRISPPTTPPASSSGFGGSCSTTLTANAVIANELNSEPLSGTAEEKISREELKRRRSSGLGGSGKQKSSGAANGVVDATAVTQHLGKLRGNPARLETGAAGRATSFDDLDSKLESEYIQRFLGQLTPLEESRLCELYVLQSTHKGKIPNDAHLLRFLRARDFDVQKANHMIVNSLLWRKQHNVDKILQDFVPPPLLVKYFPGGWHYQDNQGRPLFILRLGQMDIKGLLRSVGLEAIVKFTLSICEQGLLKTADATKRLENPISAWTLLVDLDGLSMRHLWRPGVQCLLRIIEMLEAHYPECLGMVLIIRAPRVFPTLWTLISPFIDENTRKKFVLYASDQLLQELPRYIPEDYLPDFLGGKSRFDCAAISEPPWMVPKSEYLPIPGGELLRETNDILTNTYAQVVVNRGSPYEVCVWVQQAGSVLTWDFDIIKGECEFVIYYSEKKISSKTSLSGHSSSAAAAASSGPSTTANTPGPLDRVVDTVTSELSNLLSPSTTVPHFHAIECEPGFRVGVELTIIGHPLDFKETDSMQGTTYCDKEGTYILQWRHPNEFAGAVQTETNKKESSHLGDREGGGSHASTTTQQQKTSTSGTTHKCRLMVYYELLNSKDFKGSVASLESCRSSFNSLAAAAVQENKKQQNIKKDSNEGISIEEDYSTATEKTPKN
ncbi:hypothetical protein ACQ4LE_010254 [Meloidogyne hapla]|uniref:CRAL-TRIO domain-containing protein n=1 Tax=Meloidogyne hapla TaxID=6305 RepID=A0A1I8BY03_MELHA